MESQINAYLVDLAKSLTAKDFESRTNERGKTYFTTKQIAVPGFTMAVPGTDKVGTARITFCVNLTGITTAEQAEARAVDEAENALAGLTPEVRDALLEKYANVKA